MALDKVVDSSVLDAGMASVADAIRTKAGTTDPLVWPDGFASAVGAISGGVGDQVEKGSFVADSTGNITIPCEFEPDVILISREQDINPDGDVKGITEVRIIKNWFTSGRYVSANGATNATDGSREWAPSGYGSVGLSYTDGAVSGKPYVSGRNLQNGYAYNYVFGRCGL